MFCGLDKRELGDRSLPPHVRGVLLKREFAPTLELALSLHPQTKQVVVVAGTSEFDTRLLDLARQEFSVYESRLTFTYLTTLPLQKLLTELARTAAAHHRAVHHAFSRRRRRVFRSTRGRTTCFSRSERARLWLPRSISWSWHRRGKPVQSLYAGHRGRKAGLAGLGRV